MAKKEHHKEEKHKKEEKKKGMMGKMMDKAEGKMKKACK